MAISNNKIVAPVVITDPYNLLGIYPKTGVWDVADIVGLERPSLQGGHPGRINKWSRHKPVRYPQAAPLSDNYRVEGSSATGEPIITYIDQWEGSDTDKNTGIRYGLKATIPHGTNLVAIHDTTFDYVAYPHPGTDFCRLSDFDGYDHAAKPNLLGSQITEISADYAYLDVQVDYYDSTINPTGVPIDAWLALASDKSVGDYYPAILVTTESGGSYARLLTNSEAGQITTLRHGGKWYSMFKVKFFNDATTSSVAPPGQSDTFPGDISIGSKLKVTLFIIDRKSFEFWTGVSTQLTLGDYFPIPTSIAMEVKVTSVYTAIEIVSFIYNSLQDKFQVEISFPDGNPPIGEKYKFSIGGGGFSGAETITYTGDIARFVMITPSIRPFNSGQKEVSCSIYGVNQSGGTGILLASASTSFYYDVQGGGGLLD